MRPRTYALSARTGRPEETLWDLVRLRVADLDGDGIADLCAVSEGLPRAGPKLVAVRGGPPEAWRRLGCWEPAADFDGDGIADLLPGVDRRGGGREPRATAVSGRDGRALWQSGTRGARLFSRPGPESDLDGDGAPDVLVVQPDDRWPGTILALSGRDGVRLWSASDLPGQPNDRGEPPILLDFSPDQDGDGRPDVIASYALEEVTPSGSKELVEWSIVLSGRRGTGLATLDSRADRGSPRAGGSGSLCRPSPPMTWGIRCRWCARSRPSTSEAPLGSWRSSPPGPSVGCRRRRSRAGSRPGGRDRARDGSRRAFGLPRVDRRDTPGAWRRPMVPGRPGSVG